MPAWTTNECANWAAIAAAAIAFVALLFAARAANAAVQQTRIQRQLREDAAQPNIWVDIRPSDDAELFVILLLGNTGPTVATDVKVTFQPSLSPPDQRLMNEQTRTLPVAGADVA